MRQVHTLLPALFPEAASFPYVDALTTIMSFTAMWLMAQKRIESWYYWIIVDMIGIWLYYVKEVRFISLCKVCDYYFGNARQGGSNHRIYKTPWQGDPRVNI